MHELWQGFMISSLIGKSIVLVQIAASVVMVALVIGKATTLWRLAMTTRRVHRDVMGGQNVLEYYLARHHNHHSPIEEIYACACERLLGLLSPEARAGLASGRATGALSEHETELVRSICEHVLDEADIKVRRGMGALSSIVTLAPMFGLLGTVWGVLEAFADIGAAGSANIATMAPSISSALVTTVVGLLVAIPGHAAHEVLSTRLRRLMTDVEGFTDDLVGRIALEYQG